MYRILRDEEQLAHRERTRPPSPRQISSHTASGPDELYSWDITYLPASVRGTFHFLYLFVDIWSRKIVAHSVEAEQDDELAAGIFKSACKKSGVNPRGIVLHSDNGDPMKGNTMLRTLEDLGVIPSFSRPGVSDDNAYSEALFRTVKFRPGYPRRFDSLEAARAWVDAFVACTMTSTGTVRSNMSRPRNATPAPMQRSSAPEASSTNVPAHDTPSAGLVEREIGSALKLLF